MGPLGKEAQPVGNFPPHITLADQRCSQLPPQWLNCDLRRFDYSVLGKFHVILADPPWDIHMSVRVTLSASVGGWLTDGTVATLWHHD
jgi:hypothetical protein